MSKDAWKDTGDCAECRRKQYCKKQCTARKKWLRAYIKKHFIHSATTGKLYPRPAHLAEENENGNQISEA